MEEFVDKGLYEEYLLEDENGNTVSTNENHLFETEDGWKFAREIEDGEGVLKEDGKFHPVKIRNTGKEIPIVDIVVGHKNHRYYANGFSSHNTNVGKSLIMCAIAASVLMQGYNVVYITAEMAEEKIAERMDANLMNISLDDIETIGSAKLLKTFQTKIQTKTNGRLFIKEYPTSFGHVGHVRHYLKELEQKERMKADIIFVDYLGIMASQRLRADAKEFSRLKAVSEEFRGLGIEFNIPVVSGAQTNRGGQDSMEVDLKDTAESFGLPQTADLMLAVMENEMLAELGAFLCTQLKNRYRDKNKNRSFLLGVEKDYQRLRDVSEYEESRFFGAGDQSVAGDDDDGPAFDRTGAGARVGAERREKLQWEFD